MNEQTTVHALYSKLLRLYPRAFRERLGKSMEQTFHDLYGEPKRQPDHGFFLLTIFAETALGITREHLLIFMEGNAVKNILANPRSAAIVSFIVSLPLGLLFIIFNLDIKPWTALVTSWLTVNVSDVNGLGRLVLIGGLFLLPVAFVINLRPMLKREVPEGKGRLYAINLIVGAAILLLIIFTWGGLIVEEIYCLRGIRCD